MKALLLTAAFWASSCGAQAADDPRVSDTRVHLFKADTGTWSEDVVERDLWNRVDARAALVIVQVSGPPGVRGKYPLRLVALERGRARPLLDRSQDVPALNAEGKAHLAFLLYPSGCAPVRLQVMLTGPRPTKPVERFVNFACGE